MNEVKVFDPQGKLKQVISPEELIERGLKDLPKNVMRYQQKPSIAIVCIMCGDTVKVQNRRRNQCGKKECRSAYNTYKSKNRRERQP